MSNFKHKTTAIKGLGTEPSYPPVLFLHNYQGETTKKPLLFSYNQLLITPKNNYFSFSLLSN